MSKVTHAIEGVRVAVEVCKSPANAIYLSNAILDLDRRLTAIEEAARPGTNAALYDPADVAFKSDQPPPAADVEERSRVEAARERTIDTLFYGIDIDGEFRNKCRRLVDDYSAVVTADLRAQVEKAAKRLLVAGSTEARLNEHLADKDRTIAELRRELERASAEMTRSHGSLARAEQKFNEQQNTIEDLQRQLARQAVEIEDSKSHAREWEGQAQLASRPAPGDSDELARAVRNASSILRLLAHRQCEDRERSSVVGNMTKNDVLEYSDALDRALKSCESDASPTSRPAPGEVPELTYADIEGAWNECVWPGQKPFPVVGETERPILLNRIRACIRAAFAKMPRREPFNASDWLRVHAPSFPYPSARQAYLDGFNQALEAAGVEVKR